MSNAPREYWLCQRDNQVLVMTETLTDEIKVCSVDLADGQAYPDPARPWTARKVGLPLSYGLLLHHLGLRAELESAKLLAAWLRSPFFKQVMQGFHKSHVVFTSWFLNEWIVERLLEAVQKHAALVAKMKSAGMSMN